MIIDSKIFINQKTLNDDLNEIINFPLPYEEFENSTFLITGAAGFLPAYIVESLLYLNKKKNLNIKILALVRSLSKAKLRFKEHENDENLVLINQDVSEHPFPKFSNVDFIVHAASQASPIFYKTDPVGTLKANTLGTINLLELAKEHKTKDFLYFSSGEIYGQQPEELIPIKENTFGRVDTTSVRSCYAESKRMGETACVSYSFQYGLSTKIVRPFHTYGPGMSLSDGRVFSDFVSNIVHNQDIVLKSDGSAIRPYCYISDAIVAFFTVILKGKSGEAYNVGNPYAEVSVLELAQRLINLYPEKNLKLKQENRTKNDPYVQSPIQRNCPDISKIAELGWMPRYSIEGGFKKTIESYHENQ